MRTRERLITTASEVIKRKGYFGTGINEVLAAVGVPKGSLYHHFPAGKDELIREAVVHGGRSHLRRYGEALRGKQVMDGLFAVIDAMIVELRDSDFRDACPIAAVAVASGSINEDIRAACDAVFARWEGALAVYLKRCGVEGAAEKAKELYVLFEGAYILAKAHRNVAYLELQKRFIPTVIAIETLEK